MEKSSDRLNCQLDACAAHQLDVKCLFDTISQPALMSDATLIHLPADCQMVLGKFTSEIISRVLENLLHSRAYQLDVKCFYEHISQPALMSVSMRSPHQRLVSFYYFLF